MCEITDPVLCNRQTFISKNLLQVLWLLEKLFLFPTMATALHLAMLACFKSYLISLFSALVLFLFLSHTYLTWTVFLVVE